MSEKMIGPFQLPDDFEFKVNYHSCIDTISFEAQKVKYYWSIDIRVPNFIAEYLTKYIPIKAVYEKCKVTK